MRHWENLNARPRYRPAESPVCGGLSAWLWGGTGLRALAAAALVLLVFETIAPAFGQTPSVFVRSGPVLATDDGFFSDTNVGWSIQGGARQPIAPPGEAGYLFVDLGGSFLSISGDDNPITTPGSVSIFNGVTGAIQVTSLDDLFSTRLRQVRRASVDLAVGWHHNPPRRNAATGSLLQYTVRGGGRVGQMHGKFNSEATPTLNAILAGVGPDETATVNSNFFKRDTFGGLFGGAGIAVNSRQVCTRALGPLDISWGAEAEFSYDWIDFKNFEDDGIGTAAILLNLSVSR